MPRGGTREGAGRPKGALTVRTRKIAERALATGKTPLEVMVENMRHFQQVAFDAEAVLAGMKSDDLVQGSAEDQFRALLAEVKKAAGLRQMAQECARDAAPYIHPRLSTVAHTGEDGGPVQVSVVKFTEQKDD